MGHLSHSYRDGSRGRSLGSAPGKLFAHLQCAGCPARGEVRLRQVMPPEQIDQKFRQAGWSVDPHQCPACLTRRAKERATMATKPTPSAIKAQARMFTLLQQYFDGDAGRYAADWSDAKIAAEAGVALDYVSEVRREALGEIREPAALAAIRSDISALEALAREQQGSIAQEIASLRTRLGDACKALGI